MHDRIHKYFGECHPLQHEGSFINSSQSWVSLLQQFQYFFKSWKTACPLWYPQASSWFYSSRKSLRQPWLMHLNLPYFVLNNFLSYLFFSASYFFFFSYKSKLWGKITFIVLVDILDDNWFLLLFFQCICCIIYCVWLIKLRILFFVSVSTNSASWKFLELIPIIDSFFTTSPSFFSIVKNRLSTMIVTGSIRILIFFVILQASRMFASQLTFVSWHFKVENNGKCLNIINSKVDNFFKSIEK